MTTATRQVIARFARALGPVICTPQMVMGDGRRLEPARYREFLWRCPVCGAGDSDGDHGDGGILRTLALAYRPLLVDSDGRVMCLANGCAPEEIATEVRVRLDTLAILDSIKRPWTEDEAAL